MSERRPLSRSEGLAWAEAWQHAQSAKEHAEESMERAGTRLCQRAQEVLLAGHHLTRTGQYPEVIEVLAAGVRFHVSNSIDRADDFDILLLWDDLTPTSGTSPLCEHPDCACPPLEGPCNPEADASGSRDGAT